VGGGGGGGGVGEGGFGLGGGGVGGGGGGGGGGGVGWGLVGFRHCVVDGGFTPTHDKKSIGTVDGKRKELRINVGEHMPSGRPPSVLRREYVGRANGVLKN